MSESTGTGWFSDSQATLGDRIAGAREAAGLSQDDMARRLGVRRATLQAWEDDRMDPRANRLQMMAGLLNVSIRWLLTGEGPGIEGPAGPRRLRPGAQTALAEVARLRQAALVLAQDLGHLEKRLRAELREETE